MSGPICQECGCPSLRRIDDASVGEWPVECEFCGWSGDAAQLPRKMLTRDSYEEWARKMALFRAGRFAVVRVRVDERVNPDVAFEVLRVLKVSSGSHRTRDGFVLMRVEMETAPSDDLLDELHAIKGVLDVIVRKH